VSDTQPKLAETADLADYGLVGEAAVPVRFLHLAVTATPIPAAYIRYHPVYEFPRNVGKFS
jgi:hypothetical protein